MIITHSMDQRTRRVFWAAVWMEPNLGRGMRKGLTKPLFNKKLVNTALPS